MQVVLVMFRNDGERRSFSVVRNMTVIGRREDCDLRIPVGDVSRKHCRILTNDESVSIEDLGSSNGTYVNHERVQHCDLNPGDTIGVGPVQFVVQINGVPDEDEMTAPTAAPAMAHEDDSTAGDQASVAAEEELEVEEPILEEEPEEEGESLEELPAEEMALEEEPAVEELSEPVEELEIDEAPAEAEEELEPLEELEETAVPEDELEESPLAAEPVEADNLEDLELDELPAEPEAAVEEELEEIPLPPPAHAEEAIEELELDGDEPAAPHAHANGGSAEGSAWDFVIEETETERSPHELHVDLDAPHQQPHQ